MGVGELAVVKFAGRKRPYTIAEIAQKRCVACGHQARYQWQCCANGNRWLPLCRQCDVALNEAALAIMRVPGRAKMLAAYRRRA